MFNVDERTSVKTARTSLRPRLHSMIHVEIHVCGGHPWLVTFRLCSLIRVIVAVTVTDWEDFCLCVVFLRYARPLRGDDRAGRRPPRGPARRKLGADGTEDHRTCVFRPPPPRCLLTDRENRKAHRGGSRDTIIIM